MLRKPYHAVPPTGEQRFEGLVEQVDRLAVEHGSLRQRTLYGDLSNVLHDGSDEDTMLLFKTLALFATRMTTNDLANSVGKQMIAQELLGQYPDPENPPRLLDTAFLEDRDQPGSWLETIYSLGKPELRGSYLAGCLMPTQTNYPGRWPALELTSRLHGQTHPAVAELGSAAGWILKQAALKDEGFPTDELEVGQLSASRRRFVADSRLTAWVNRLLQNPDFSISQAKGFDILPAKSPMQQAKVKAYMLYPEDLINRVTQSNTQRLIDHPWPENVQLVTEDLTLPSRDFCDAHPDDIGQYEMVILPTFLNQIPDPGNRRNVLTNARLLRRPGGLIIVQDYGRFQYPSPEHALIRQERGDFRLAKNWDAYTYRQWVDDDSSEELNFKPIGRFETGRARRLALSRHARQLITRLQAQKAT